MIYAKTFLGSTIALTLLYYLATQSGQHPLPLWPDALIIGASVGTLITLIVARFRLDAKAADHLRRLSRLMQGRE